MRLFFGLPFDRDCADQIERWRGRSLPDFRKPVDASNFHLTLSFLGEVSNRQCHDIEVLASGIQLSRFTLDLNETSYWPKQQIYYLTSSNPPPALPQLAEQVKQVARRISLRVEKRKYLPHVTLARRCDQAPPEPLTPPDFRLECEEFCLFESIRTQRGVRYEIVDSFSLLRQ